MQNYSPAPYPSYHQDGSYHHSRYRRKNKHRYTFHPTVTDDLDDYDDGFYYPSPSPPPAPYWGQMPYSTYPPAPHYPAPYPYPQYQQYPPQYQPPHDPRRPNSNFGMLIAGAFMFSMIAFAAVWYDNANEKPTEPVIIQNIPAPKPEIFDPAPDSRRHTAPKPHLKPVTRDVFAVYLETFGTEEEVNQLNHDLGRDDIIAVQMGDSYWACILANSDEEARSIKTEVTARYEQKQWKAEPYVTNLKRNCDGLEWRGEKLVCGEK